jgi:Polymerase beta, Nucleotidyltransferase
MALAGLEIPESIVSGLREGLGDDLLAVVLFGSRARGEAREGSDWDFLVVARDLPKRTLERAFRPRKCYLLYIVGRLACWPGHRKNSWRVCPTCTWTSHWTV